MSIFILSLYILIKKIYYLKTKNSLKSIILIIIYFNKQVNLAKKILTFAFVLSIISLAFFLMFLINKTNTYNNLMTNHN